MLYFNVFVVDILCMEMFSLLGLVEQVAGSLLGLVELLT